MSERKDTEEEQRQRLRNLAAFDMPATDKELNRPVRGWRAVFVLAIIAAVVIAAWLARA